MREALGLVFLTLLLPAGCTPSIGSGRSCDAVDGGHPDGEAPPIEPACPGACDEVAARSVVHDAAGRSMYAGQAIMYESCAGAGNFCHAAGANDRFGVPAGLDFDVSPTQSTLMSYDATGARRLARGHNMVHRNARAIWGTIVGGSMPPGAFRSRFLENSYGWVLDPADVTTDVAIPTLDTLAGREIVRNWLACGAPVVEALEAITLPSCATNADCATGVCEAETCAAVGDSDAPVHRMERPLEPNWRSIYLQVIEPTCITPGCHAPDPMFGNAVSANLDLSDMDQARLNLLDARTSDDEDAGALCMDETRVLVAPGEPDESFLIVKLSETDDTMRCGALMPFGTPLTAAQVDVIREWITMGAMPAP